MTDELEGAPEILYLDPYNSKDWTEGGEFVTELYVKQHPNHRVPYTRKDIADKRIAELEAVLKLISAQDKHGEFNRELSRTEPSMSKACIIARSALVTDEAAYEDGR